MSMTKTKDDEMPSNPQSYKFGPVAVFLVIAVALLPACDQSTNSEVTPTNSEVTTSCQSSTNTGNEDAAKFPPADTCGQFLPAPDYLTAGETVEACGGPWWIGPGNINKVEYRSTVLGDGSTMVEYRGKSSATVYRTEKGMNAFLDEMDTSGAASALFSADGLSVTRSWDGPNIVATGDEVEAKAFAAEGLAPIFYFETGNMTEKLEFTDSARTRIRKAELRINSAAGIHDVCAMLPQYDRR